MFSFKRAVMLAATITIVCSLSAAAQQTVRITGTVFDNKTGEPVPGVNIVAYMRERPSIKIEDVTDGKGQFKITGLPAGQAVFELTKEGYEPSRTAERLDSTRPTQKVVFRINPIIRKEGTITPEIREQYEQATALYQEGKVDEAIAIFNDLIEQHPDIHQIHNNVGIAYSAKREFDKALEHYRAALEKDPENPDIAIYIADAYLGKEDYENALEWYLKAAAAKPDFFWLINQTADIARVLQKYEMAAEYYEKAIALDAAKPLPHLYLGTFLGMDGEYGRSLAHLMKYLELDKENQAIMVAKGLIEDAIEHHEGAEAFFRDAVAGENPHPLAYFFLGKILAVKGSAAEEAKTQLNKYIELDPGDTFRANEDAKRILDALGG